MSSNKQNIIKYISLLKTYPNLFRDNPNMHIILNENELLEYSEKHKCELGIVYENDFYRVIADLISDQAGRKYVYTRVLHTAETNGVVIVPLFHNKFVLLKQFRHGTRVYEYEFPRGFGEVGYSPEENAIKELLEELSGSVRSCEYLGQIVSDTGMTGGVVDVFAAELDSIGKPEVAEGIEDYLILTQEEIDAMILSSSIRDTFTLSAYLKYLRRKEK
ncbi:MAG: NUDIX hydrolase [Oscillospiraceae bacterium]